MPSGGILNQVLETFGKPENVRISDEAKVEKLMSTIVESGPSALQVITDFDATLTRHHLNGELCDSTYGNCPLNSRGGDALSMKLTRRIRRIIQVEGIIANSPLMSDSYKEKSISLYEKYNPIEIDHELSIEDKIPHMVRWYEESHEILISSGMEKSLLKQLVHDSKALFRDQAREMLEMLSGSKVPVLICSAGLGDIVEEILHRHNLFFPNLNVMSNYMEFDENGLLVGFKDPIIHVFNKNETALHDTNNQYFVDLSHRTNAILMGDSLGDANMDNGMPSQNVVLKIGFLNQKIPERLESFMDSFDIVLLDDQSMDFVNAFLKIALKPSLCSSED